MIKTIIVFVILVNVVSCRVIVVRKGNDALWQEFKNFFNKTYTDDEDDARKPIWERALISHMKHNRGFFNGSHPYSLGLNQFTDMLEEEFKYLVSGLEKKLECENKSLVYVPPKNVSIPDRIDWNERGYVTEVQNQGACGACWAFCGIAALEGQHKRMTGQLVKLSEQQLVDCSTVTGNKKCNGGQMCRAYEYAAMVGGVVDSDYYPYKDQGGKCMYSRDKIASNITGYLDIPYGDEHALLMAVALIGPVAAGLDGYRPHFRHYKGGIYDDHGCSNVTLNHAVTIVGYGTENGKDYWLVKNSWGKHWGNNGFGKIVRNKNNQCGLASSAVLPTLSLTEDGKPKLGGHRAQ